MGCVDSEIDTVNPTQLRLPIQAQPRVSLPRAESVKIKKRLSTKYRPKDITLFKDEHCKGRIVYTCPICTNHFDRILACDKCENCVCLRCFIVYEKKMKRIFKCYFCGDTESVFRDYDKEAKKYFDTTKSCFLGKEEREEIDNGIENDENKENISKQANHKTISEENNEN